jgi:hypothetical protein
MDEMHPRQHDARAHPSRRPRGARQSALFAIAVSLFVHVGVLLSLAMIILERPVASAGNVASDAPMAVMSDAELSELMQVALSGDVPTMEQIQDPELFATEDFSSPVSEAALASLEVDNLGDFAGAAGDEIGDGLSSSSAAGGSAKFFGVEARGSRFAYICDISGSMAGERINALKGALSTSIDGLLEHTHFAIVLYNGEAYPITKDRWVSATDRSKRDVKREISVQQAFGGTDPVPAFSVVFDMKPRPDAIYFMTDGRFRNPDRVMMAIARMNDRGRTRTPIHCITFVDRSSEEVMRKIAQRSRGTYTHIGGAE